MSPVRVSHIERAIAARFPLERADEWDRCGLLAGDPDALVTGVALALDPTVDALSFAVRHGANVLVTHHPAFLKPPQWLTPGRGAAGVVFSAVSQGVALINAHTNLDRDAEAQTLIPALLGLTPSKPLERSAMPMSLVTVFAPDSAAEKIVAAMSGAGAGKLGAYDRCSFRGSGVGHFTPVAGSTPWTGASGEPSEATEARIEMVAPASKVRGVISAAVTAHPYEEPLVVASEVVIARNAARLGMVSEAAAPTSLKAFARAAGGRFGVSPRVWGDENMMVSRVATATGSASSLIGDALASGAQVLVAGEVRYHDAVDAAAAGLAVIELGHDVTEWPLVSLLEAVVRSVPDLDGESVHAMPATPGWWTP